MKVGNPGQAAMHFLAAIRLKPNYVEAYNNLGIVFAYQGRLDEAIANFRNALSINPSDSMARRNLEQAIRERGE